MRKLVQLLKTVKFSYFALETWNSLQSKIVVGGHSLLSGSAIKNLPIMQEMAGELQVFKPLPEVDPGGGNDKPTPVFCLKSRSWTEELQQNWT